MPTQPIKQNLFKKIKMYWSTSKFMLCEYPINICNFILPWCVLCIITCFMQGYVNHLLKLNFLEKLQIESQLLPKVETAKFFFSSIFLCIMPGETICYILSWLLWTISYNALPEKRTQTKLQKKTIFPHYYYHLSLIYLAWLFALVQVKPPFQKTANTNSVHAKVFTHMTTLKINILLLSKHNICANMHKWTFMALKINSQNL